MKVFLQWLVVGLLTLVALGAFKESVFGGLLMLAAAALSAPPLWQRVSSRTGFTFRKTAIAVVGIAGMAAWIASPGFQTRMAQDKAKRQAEQKQEAAANPPKLPQVETGPAPEQTKRPAEPENPYADEFKQYAWITSSEETVKQKLKDPDSAKFKNVRFYSGGGIPVACGEVNAKNGFGGYTGFERFVAVGPKAAYLDSEVAEGIGEVWDKFRVPAPDDTAGAG